MNDGFYSIDRLIEFGMGLSIAQQMARTMNETLQQSVTPGVDNLSTTNHSMMQDCRLYYAVINNQQAGPFSEVDIAKLVTEKKIVDETYIWRPGMRNWEIARNIPEILRIVALTPPSFINNNKI